MLKIGQRLVTEASREEITVVSELGSGGQGTVYRVKGKKGREWALKWYSEDALKFANEARYDALSKIMGRSPDGDVNSSFAWPVEFVKQGRNFGYIMELVDFRKYITIPKMLMGNKRLLPNQRVKTLISLNVATAFARLHAAGFCYRDINEGNILFSVETGKVKIVDNDNVGYEGSSKSAVLGLPDYMAPEILRGGGKTLPSKYTDYHSLAVFLFRLWVWHHPFEGRKALSIRCWDRDAKVKVFGMEPVFIFNEADKSNVLPMFDGGDSFAYAHKFWRALPERLKELFATAFGAGAKNPSDRVIETRWIKQFAVMYDTIAECPKDGAENFWNEGSPTIECWKCRVPFAAPVRLKVVNAANNTRVAALVLKPDAKLFARHMTPDAKDGDRALGTVVRHPQNPDVWGLRNDEKAEWTFTNPDGREIAVPTGKSVPVADGNRIDFKNGRQGVFER